MQIKIVNLKRIALEWRKPFVTVSNSILISADAIEETNLTTDLKTDQWQFVKQKRSARDFGEAIMGKPRLF